MTQTNVPQTKGPITTDGWYEHTDGTFGFYAWNAGRARMVQGPCAANDCVLCDEHGEVSVGWPARMARRRYATYGNVRGLGPIRMTRERAEADLADDNAGCAAQGGYSDRRLVLVDYEGYVVEDDGTDATNVWHHGRTHRALRVEVKS